MTSLHLENGLQRETRHCEGTLKELYQDKSLLKNVGVVSLIWAFTSFTYYLIILKLKSLPGNIFVNSIYSSFANALGHFSALWLYKMMKVRNVMVFYFVLELVGSIPLCF